jgi:hypothetical protein
MLSDRQRRRAVLFATGIVYSTISTGCLTSSFVRRAGDPNSEPASAASENLSERRDVQKLTRPGRMDSSVRSASVQAADAPLVGASAATPFLTAPGPSSPAPAGPFPLELQAVPTESTGKAVPGAAGSPPTVPSALHPAPVSTPLIDAAIQRVADITRQQREAIASSPTPDTTEEPKRARVPSLISATQPLVAEPARPDHLLQNDAVPPLPERLSGNAEDEPLKGPTRFLDSTPHRNANDQPARGEPRPPGAETAPKPSETKPVVDPKATEGGVKPAESQAPRAKEQREIVTTDVRPGNSEPDDEAASAVEIRESTAVRGGALAISELRLCRSISGFGSFEPLRDERIKAGQRLLVYCELTGLRYEMQEAGFVSRISSRIELKRVQGGPVVWEQELGDAEDACRRRRRDYYVNYFIDLPKSLRPGSYRLRLLQTDLVAGASTSTDIPIEVTP